MQGRAVRLVGVMPRRGRGGLPETVDLAVDQQHDARRRRPEGRRRLDVRLAPADEGAVDHLEVGHSVGVSASGERFERLDLVGPGGDDELAAALARHPVLRAEGVQPLASLDAQDGLQRVGRVVDAGMNGATIAAMKEARQSSPCSEDGLEGATRRHRDPAGGGVRGSPAAGRPCRRRSRRPGGGRPCGGGRHGPRRSRP